VIEISLESSGEQWLIKILDNGPGEGRRNSLQFSISTQIIHEHEGLVELSAQPRQMTMAKISLPQRGF
jgi:nitrogen-specific signal transduction histidine kinase